MIFIFYFWEILTFKDEDFISEVIGFGWCIFFVCIFDFFFIGGGLIGLYVRWGMR